MEQRNSLSEEGQIRKWEHGPVERALTDKARDLDYIFSSTN